MIDCLDTADFPVLDAKSLRDFPGPGRRGPAGHRAPVGYLEGTRLARGVIEETERQSHSAFRVDDDEASIADSCHKVK